MNKRRIAILGSTGSIGTQALDVVRQHPELFEVKLLTAMNNSMLLIEQAKEFSPDTVIIGNDSLYGEVFNALDPLDIKVFAGDSSITDCVASDSIDIVLVSVSGFSGLNPILTAIRAGKAVAIANKEPIVAAGKIIMEEAAKYNAPILPVDSEHSAIFQCLQGENTPIETIFLTASGGPFLRSPLSELESVTPREAVAHPRWAMGRKVSIDSATLMNKGFEMIEACHLFGVDYSQVTVVIHPQSVIHSMVAFRDGSVIAQMSMPDMRLPIQYALTYPERQALSIPKIDFFKLGGLTFSEPDMNKFPCLAIAFDAIRKGGNIPCAMNAADEIAVSAFCEGRIRFTDIPVIISKCISHCDFVRTPDIDTILQTDTATREYAKRIIEKQK